MKKNHEELEQQAKSRKVAPQGRIYNRIGGVRARAHRSDHPYSCICDAR